MAQAEINGVSLYFETHGTGEPVAFLNGILMTTASWAAVRSAVERHYHCVMHDLRGQLMSDKGQGEWTMAQHADDLAALLDQLGIESCHLVGTSYGGEVALMFALAYPERARSLSIIASVSEVSPELMARVGAWSEAARLGPGAMFRSVAADSYSEGFLRDHPDLIETGSAKLAALPPEFFEGFGRLERAFRQLDITSRLGSIAAPTLVVAAELDSLKPPRACESMARAIPDCRLVTIPECGHAAVIERPGAVSEHVLAHIARAEADRSAASGRGSDS